MTWPVDTDGSLTRWPFAQEIRERLIELQGLHPGRCTVADLNEPTTRFPASTTDRTVVRNFTGNFLRIGRASQGGTARNVVVLIGGMHAREWGPPTALVNLAEKLMVAHAGGTPIVAGGFRIEADTVRAIHEQVDLFIAPLMNPDGYEFSQVFDDRTGDMESRAAERGWRKNRRPAPASHPGCPDDEAIGVDVNRNFDVLWEFNRFYLADADVQAATDPCDNTFIGPSAFSEAESRNVRHLVESTNPNVFVDCHMFGEVILHLWGTEENGPVDGAVTPPMDMGRVRNGHSEIEGVANFTEKIAQEFLTIHTGIAGLMSDATNAATGRRYNPHEASFAVCKPGVSRDWVFARNIGTNRTKCHSYTLESGRSFLPTFDTEFPDIQREVHAALLAVLNRATTAIAGSTAGAAAGPAPGASPSSTCRC
jgi:carboxypeptidase T